MGRPTAESLRAMIEWHALEDTIELLEAERSLLRDKLLEHSLEPMPGLQRTARRARSGRRAEGDRHQRPSLVRGVRAAAGSICTRASSSCSPAKTWSTASRRRTSINSRPRSSASRRRRRWCSKTASTAAAPESRPARSPSRCRTATRAATISTGVALRRRHAGRSADSASARHRELKATIA